MAGAVAGTVFAIEQIDPDHPFANSNFATQGIAAVLLPQVFEDEIGFNPGLILGSFITPRAAGFADNVFTDTADFLADATLVPEKYRRLGRIFFNNGVNYVTNLGLGGQETFTVTISGPGSGYSTTSETTTRPASTTEEDEFYGDGLTVEITSVGASGEITGVNVVNGGSGYEVGDVVDVVGGNGGQLTISSLFSPPIGEFSTGRGGTDQNGPNDMNPSNFTTLPLGYTAEELDIVAVSTGQIMPYNASLPAPFTHDSFGDCFSGGNFDVNVVVSATRDVIGTLTVPLDSGSGNTVVSFGRSYE